MSTAGTDLAMATPINRTNLGKKKEAAFSLFARNYSHPEISSEIGVSTRTLSRWRSDYEIQINSCPAIKPKSDSEIATIAQNTTSKRINDLLDLALDILQDILSDQQTRRADQLKAISLVGEWARLGKPSTTDEKIKNEFPFFIEAGQKCQEISKLSDSELKELYFKHLQETN